MKIAIIGTGYVGLVSGTCFAEMGHNVICVDKDKEKIDNLQKGKIPIYEPGLSEMVLRNNQIERLSFTTDISYAVKESLFIFIAIDTPSNLNGKVDLTNILGVINNIVESMNDYKVIVNKSTVPVGTSEILRTEINRVKKEKNINHNFDLVSNPEFLKEGDAIRDFMKPDRIVIGVNNKKTAKLMKELYQQLMLTGHPIIVMDIKSAEMTKYASNALPATRISFMNEMANLCDTVGADVDAVRRGIGSDSRIGNKFLFPGIGFGGSCFPKDIRAIIGKADYLNSPLEVIKAVYRSNERQKLVLFEKMNKFFDQNFEGRKIAIWGLSFKPNTDDMREAPSQNIINKLLEQGAVVQVFDPEAMQEAVKVFGDNKNIIYGQDPYQILEGSDALMLLTEWSCFRSPDFKQIKTLLKNQIIFDGRNQYSPSKMRELGFTYFSIGRDSVTETIENGF